MNISELQQSYCAAVTILGVSSTKDFIFESEFSNLANIRKSNHMFGGGAKYITKSQVRHSTVIITDFNTHGKCVMDASQI